VHPPGTVDNRVDAWQFHLTSAQEGFAITGVEGTASRAASIGPARRARAGIYRLCEACAIWAG